MLFMAPLSNRGVLRIAGEDAKKFLQGLITNDSEQVSEKKTIYTAFLSPQGKFLYDFFISEHQGRLFLDVEKDRLEDLQKRLKIYKLKSKVEIEDVSDRYSLWAFWGEKTEEHFKLSLIRGETHTEQEDIFFVDPRWEKIGVRGFIHHSQEDQTNQINLEKLGFQKVSFEIYDQRRLRHGLPDGSRDMVIDRAIPLECGLEDLNAISWTKGCYMGQELTARTKHRGLVRKRYFPVEFEGTAPLLGTKVIQGEDEVGEIYSSNGDIALARLKLEALAKGEALSADKKTLKVLKPDWMPYDEIMKEASQTS